MRNVHQLASIATHRGVTLHISSGGVGWWNSNRPEIFRQRADLVHFLFGAEQEIFVLMVETGQSAHNIARVRAHAELVHPADINGNLHRKILLGMKAGRLKFSGPD